MLNITSDIILQPTKFFQEYYGAFIENFINNELMKLGKKELFYWTSKSDAEVDFVIQQGQEIIPIEVKSDLNRNMKNLRGYADKYQPRIIVRYSPRNFIKSDDFVNIPLYGIFVFDQLMVHG